MRILTPPFPPHPQVKSISQHESTQNQTEQQQREGPRENRERGAGGLLHRRAPPLVLLHRGRGPPSPPVATQHSHLSGGRRTREGFFFETVDERES